MQLQNESVFADVALFMVNRSINSYKFNNRRFYCMGMSLCVSFDFLGLDLRMGLISFIG